MSGHSKWHNIQERKGKQDAKRSGQFTKVAKTITIAAQHGGDPAMNFSLRLAIDKAKEVGMPKDNIDRAIKRGTGELTGEAQMEEVLYEAFGPGGVAILVKTVTDNKNRTVSDLKHILNMHGGSFGSAGSVQWMFQQWGVITVSPYTGGHMGGVGRDDLELTLIESGAEDITETENEIEIKTKIENFQKVINKLKELGIEPKESGIHWVAKDKVKVNKETEEKLGDLFSDLEARDDVEDYFTNAE
ncbi:MAG: YebC/PmpR family DNA-binding transcriptional regulator [Candidatus Magasanikbacteria bacterium]|nr:YebC/PmpR family DNA-binding transcriptional regulator [Candidatus Magasanikbacteria bacterium]